MKLYASLLVAVIAISCAPTKAPPATPQTTPKATPKPPQASPAAAPAANWTIICTVVGGPNHVAKSAAFKAHLIQATGMREWHVIHTETESTLYYGNYRTIDERQDKREAERAKGDQKAIAALVDKNAGARMFPTACLVPVESPDPPAPQEWNLVNAKGYWTLQIGVCKGDQRRKQFAVDAVREARGQGYEAYYYHGPTASSVCIGSWAESAVKKETDIKAKNPNDVVVAMPDSVPVTEGTRVAADGTVVDVVKPKIQILDASLAGMLKAFPVCAVNGVEERKVKDARTGQVRTVREPSLLVAIPRHVAAAGGSAATPAVQESPMGSGAARPAQQPRPVGGRLRGLE